MLCLASWLVHSGQDGKGLHGGINYGVMQLQVLWGSVVKPIAPIWEPITVMGSTVNHSSYQELISQSCALSIVMCHKQNSRMSNYLLVINLSIGLWAGMSAWVSYLGRHVGHSISDMMILYGLLGSHQLIPFSWPVLSDTFHNVLATQ